MSKENLSDHVTDGADLVSELEPVISTVKNTARLINWITGDDKKPEVVVVDPDDYSHDGSVPE